MKTTNEVSDETFERSVKNINPVPEEPLYSFRSNIPITYTSYDAYEKFNRIEEPEWDHEKDCEKKEIELKKLGPPPRPKFNQTNRGHKIIPIEEIINEPGRKSRPEKIVIVIRGAPSSGKSYLANQILEHEKKFRNKRIKFFTPNKYYCKSKFERDIVDKYLNNLHSDVIDHMKEGFYSFIIVEMEGFKLDVYNKIADVAKEAEYEIYGIDIIQELEVCIKYLKHSRAYMDVQEIAKGIISTPVPYYHKILDPMELIEPGWRARQPPKPITPPPKQRFLRRTPSPTRRRGRRRRSSSDSDDSDDDCFSCY